MVEDSGERSQSVVTSNVDSVSANALQIRLITDELMQKLEVYLKGGYSITVQNSDGEPVIKSYKTGTAKANCEGIQSIMSYVSNIVNPHVVQGNFDRDMFWDYIREVNIDLACYIAMNLAKWEISENDYDGLIDHIMKLVIPFISRLIDNKERESYTSTLQHRDSIMSKEKKEGFKLFG